MPSHNVVFRPPALSDATAIFDLVEACKPLDLNSHYLYLLQCSHFADTCVVAEVDGKVVGWVSGYLVNKINNSFFIWQVAVSPKARGLGLAKRMIQWLIERHPTATELHTSITPGNEASWQLFTSLAQQWGGDLQSADWFERDAHFAGRHDTEVLVRISLPSHQSIAA